MYHQIGIYAIVFMVTLNTIAVVYGIGKKREPISNGDAVAVMILNAVIITILLS
jgi:hypothetical protein